MTDTPKPGTDDATFGLLLFLVVVGTLAATAISVVTASALLVVAWFFGQPRRTAFIALGVAAGAVAVQPLVPGFVAFVEAAFIAYRDASQRDHYGISVAIQWLRFATDPVAWFRLLPGGLLTGAVLLLAIETQRNSVAAKVFGKKRMRPSPWARLKTRRVLKGPAIYKGRIVLGAEKLTGERVCVSREQLNQHQFISGRSGRGKTETTLTLCAGSAQLGIPVFFADGKGDPALLRDLRQIARANGRPFYAFDLMNASTSCAFDIFAGMNPTTQADVVMALRDYSEPHYEGQAGKFIGVTTRVLQHVESPVDLFTIKESLSVDRLLALLRHHTDKGDDEGRALMEEVKSLRGSQKEALDSLMPELGRLTDAVFGFLFDIERAKREHRPILRLLEARKQRAVVCFSLPPLEYEKMTPKVGSALISAVKAILPALDREHRAQSDEPLPLEAKQLVCIFDEWSVFAGDGRHVVHIVNQGRTYGGSFCCAGQSYADFLADGHDKFLRQIAASTNTFIIHELNDAQDAEYAAGILATRDAVGFTAQMGTPTEAGSARSIKEYSAHPDEIKNLGVGEAFYVDKNAKDPRTGRSIIRLIMVRKTIR